MYGVLVGKAMKDVAQGGAITVDNMKHASAEYSGKKEKPHWLGPDVSKWKDRTFNGYHREDGKVGTGNYWIVFALTFCENRNLDVLKTALTESLGYETTRDFSVNTQALVDVMKNGGSEEEILNTEIIKTQEEIIKSRIFPNVDGIKILRHEGGCGGTRGDSEVLCNLLAGYLTNPNVAGGTVLEPWMSKCTDQCAGRGHQEKRS